MSDAGRAELVMSERQSHVRTDEHGVLRVGNTRVMLDSVVASFHQGHSPETIRDQYPALSLEQVDGAIAFYLAHTAEVDDYLRRQDQIWRSSRAQAEAVPNPVRERLRALRHASAPVPS